MFKDKNTVQRDFRIHAAVQRWDYKTCIFMAMGYEDCVGKENT
jgi:hypothetical protein